MIFFIYFIKKKVMNTQKQNKTQTQYKNDYFSTIKNVLQNTNIITFFNINELLNLSKICIDFEQKVNNNIYYKKAKKYRLHYIQSLSSKIVSSSVKIDNIFPFRIHRYRYKQNLQMQKIQCVAITRKKHRCQNYGWAQNMFGFICFTHKKTICVC